MGATVWLRQVIRVGASYYVALPKSVLSEFGIMRGSKLLVTLEKKRIVMEVATDGYREIFRRTK